jgi:polyhydroxyalkanoate synthesis regulator phasin
MSKKKELQYKLNMANRTVHDLMQEVQFYKELAQDTSDEMMDSIRSINSKAVKNIESQHEAHNRQMQVAESEIKRLNTIIHYLEEKTFKVYE